MHCGAGDRLGSRRGAAAGTGLAALEDGELDLLLGPLDRLLEGDPQVVAEVRPGLRPAAPRGPGPGGAAEERVEDVAEPAEPLEAGRPCAAQPGPAEHVVAAASIGIREDLVGLVDLGEPVVRARVGVDVRVPLLGELAVGALDLGVGRAALDAEDVVVVAFGGGHSDEKNTGDRRSIGRRVAAGSAPGDLRAARLSTDLEHRRRQPAGEGVLLARVVRTDDRSTAGLGRRAVAEPRTRADVLAGTAAIARNADSQAYAPSATMHPHPVEQGELAGQERRAVVALGRQRLVGRRRAPDGRGDVRIDQGQPVVRAPAGRADWPARRRAARRTGSRPMRRR